MIEFLAIIEPPYTIMDMILAWALGMFTAIPLVLMSFRILPWLSGWRQASYNIHWTDTNKRLWLWKQVKWRE